MSPKSLDHPTRRRTDVSASGSGAPADRPATKFIAWTPETENNVENLLTILRAASFRPPRYVKSIFGSYFTWLRPHRAYSELTILDLWHPIRALRFFRDLSTPAFAKEPPDIVRTFVPPFIHEVFWRPSTFFQQPDPYGSVRSFPRERWFFINGVATNDAVARINAAFLSRLFHRPLTVIHNATDALLIDLHECAIGKEFKTRPRPGVPGTLTEPALKATDAVLRALNAPEVDKVVVLAHSQGTIIAANVLRAIHWALQHQRAFRAANLQRGTRMQPVQEFLDRLVGEARHAPAQALRDTLAADLTAFARSVEASGMRTLEKLEIYTFANCADKMKHLRTPDGRRYPWLEHFANEFDLVARLGVLSPLLAPDDAAALVDIDGPVYVQEDAWGHLLNEHHLYGIYDHLSGTAQNEPSENPYILHTAAGAEASSTPRLYAYFEGGRPSDDFR